MESNASTQLKVGIFLSLGIVFILGSIFFIGADKSLFKSYARLHSHFEQVTGLAEGSVVSLSGVTVGNVEKITFLPDQNFLDVTLRIDQKYLERIHEGSQVEIRTQGALGDKFVFIIPGDPRGAAVKDGSVLGVAKATDLLGIISERGKETGKLFDTIDELYKMARTINDNNRLHKIMTGFETASMSLAQASQNAQKMTSQLADGNSGEKLRHTIDKLDAIISKIDRGEGTLGALINDPSIHNQLKSLLGGTQRKNHVKSLLRTSIEKEDE